MIVRVRTRCGLAPHAAQAASPSATPMRPLTWRALPCGSDGTEKVAVPEGASLRDLRRLLETQLAVPYADQTLSRDQGLVRAAARGARASLQLRGRPRHASQGASDAHGGAAAAGGRPEPVYRPGG